MRLFQILSAIVGFVFVGFCYVQLNDVDSALWIVTYGAVAAVSFLAAFGWGHFVVPLGVALGMTALLASIFDAGLAFDFGNEVIREEMGLAVAIAWMLVVAAVQRRTAPAN